MLPPCLIPLNPPLSIPHPQPSTRPHTHAHTLTYTRRSSRARPTRPPPAAPRPAQGLEVVPLTLEVGDYVLSPDICAERKSISDLRASLASGRLYHQAEAMTKHYKTPVLLIEFEGDKAFALQVWGGVFVSVCICVCVCVRARWASAWSARCTPRTSCPCLAAESTRGRLLGCAACPYHAAPRLLALLPGSPAAPAGLQRDWGRGAAAQPDGAHRAARPALPPPAPHLVALPPRHRRHLPAAQGQPGRARPGDRWVRGKAGSGGLGWAGLGWR